MLFFCLMLHHDNVYKQYNISDRHLVCGWNPIVKFMRFWRKMIHLVNEKREKNASSITWGLAWLSMVKLWLCWAWLGLAKVILSGFTSVDWTWLSSVWLGFAWLTKTKSYLHLHFLFPLRLTPFLFSSFFSPPHSYLVLLPLPLFLLSPSFILIQTLCFSNQNLIIVLLSPSCKALFS